MKAIELIHLIERDNVQITLTPSGRLKITGEHVERWLPILGQYGEALRAELRAELLLFEE
ncbi:MAG: hypothetical protein A3G81_05300 [Betaproteobacteria bacterium RIFCSPLOWO2_12_FULL_65_14]|nr:MAG: hypothetical protein A3G81_05300 [Betaproteobacteria bacterium RIFCSPLOWO2_12_FULL_65_14]